MALFVNEPTLAPASSAAERLRPAVRTVFDRFGLAEAFVAHEVAATETVVLAKTASRSHVGMLNEFAFLAGEWRRDVKDLGDLSVRLADVPCGPLYQRHGTPQAELRAVSSEWLRVRER